MKTIMMTRKALRAGADGALLVSPYYNKPTQEGIYRHYRKIAQIVDLPLVLYNVPGRTSSNVLPETVARLAEIDTVVAIKEATGSMKQVSDVIRLCGDRIAVLSGDDSTTFPLLMLGGKGVISVVANVIPKKVSEMCAAAGRGMVDDARAIHYELEALASAMFIETNPIPVKTAVALMGKINEEFRLPLCEMAPANRDKLKEVMKSYKLI